MTGIPTKPLPNAWVGRKPPADSPSGSFPVDRVGRTFWNLTIPTLATLAINAFIPLMDNLFLGNALGTRGVAALAWGFATIMFVISAGTWFSYGVAPKVSFALGEGNPAEADRWTRIGMIGAFLFGILLTAAVQSGLPRMISLFGGDPLAIDYLGRYLRVVSLGYPALLAGIVGAASLNARGLARFTMLCSVSGLLVGALGDWMLIFVWPFGIVGAAWGTVAGQVTVLAMTVLFLARKGLSLRPLPDRPLDGLKRILFTGFPVFISNVLGTVLVFLFNAKAEQFGGTLALAVFGLGFQVYRLALLVVLSFAQGMQPLISFFAGARQLPALRKTFFVALSASGVVAVCMWLALEAGLPVILSWVSKDPAFLDSGRRILAPSLVALPFLGLTVVGTYLFQYLERFKTSLLLQATRLLALQIPLIFVLPAVMGLDGLSIVLPLAEFISAVLAIVCLVRLARRDWGINWVQPAPAAK